MTVYGSDLELTVRKKQDKKHKAARVVDCEVLFD